MCVRECDHTWPIAGKRSQAHIALAQSSVVSASPTVAYHSATSGVGVFARYRRTQGCLRTSVRARRFSGSYCKSCGGQIEWSALMSKQNRVDEGRAGKGKGQARRTLAIKSRASAETFGGMRRSTFAIRL
jgi:hypothetical protein